MKRNYIISLMLLIIVASLVLGGCENKDKKISELREQAIVYLENGDYENTKLLYEEMLEIKDDVAIQNELNDIKIAELREQAVIYLDEADFQNAIELYEKMLILKEDVAIREELKEIKYELESADTTKEFLDVIESANINYNRPNSLVEVKDVFLEIQKVVNNIEKIDTAKNTDIALYLNEIKNLYEYKALKDLINMEYIMNAEKSESLGSIQSGMGMGSSLSYGSALIVGQAKSNLKQHTDYILEIEIPSKYKGIL